MRLVHDRTAAAADLSFAIKQRGRVQKSDLATVKNLIEEEQESLERSLNTVNNKSYKESYRKGQQVAVDNSRAIIEILKSAVDAIKTSRDAELAAKLLAEAATYRDSRKQRPRGRPTEINVLRLYQEYQARHDKGFHKWLKDTGQHEALISLDVARADAPVSTGFSNRPEDYT